MRPTHEQAVAYVKKLYLGREVTTRCRDDWEDGYPVVLVKTYGPLEVCDEWVVWLADDEIYGELDGLPAWLPVDCRPWWVRHSARGAA